MKCAKLHPGMPAQQYLCGYGKCRVNDDSKPFATAVFFDAAEM
jgi:hypothetical protein